MKEIGMHPMLFALICAEAFDSRSKVMVKFL
jgi:hypothetical protein